MNARRKLFFLSGKGDSPAPVGLLNTTEGAGAIVGISARMLDSAYYDTNVYRIMRESDASFANVRLSASSGVPQLDNDSIVTLETNGSQTSLQNWLGTGRGLFQRIEDQSGSTHYAYQNVENLMPIAYDNGVDKVAGRTMLRFNDKTFRIKDFIPPANTSDGFHFFVVSKGDVGADYLISSYNGTGSYASVFIIYFKNRNAASWYRTNTLPSTILPSGDIAAYNAINVHINQDFMTVYLGETELGQISPGGTVDPTDELVIGGRGDETSSFWNGVIPEIVIYPALKPTLERETIFQNQNLYYGGIA